jgi:MFS family permease
LPLASPATLGPTAPVPDAPAGPGPVGRGPFRLTAYVLGVTAFGAGVPTPLYSIYQQQFHFAPGVLAEVFGAYTIGVLATMLFVAPLSDAVGRKPILYVGMALTAASAVVFLFASGVAVLAIARVVSGLAVGATTSTATAAMASLEPRRDQHHVARVSVAANFGGVATGILLSGLLVQYAPLRTELVFLVLIAASLAGVGAVAATPETVLDLASGAPLRSQRIQVPPEIRRPFWVAAGALAATYSIYGFFAALAPTFLRSDLGLDNRAAAGAIVAGLFGLAAIVQLGLGQVRDRRALLVGLPVMLAALFAFVLSLTFASLGLLVAAAAVLGAGLGSAYMGSVTLADRVAPAAIRGEVLSAFFVVGYLALAAPTIGVGLASDRVGLETAALAFGIALGLFVLALTVVTQRTPTPPGGEGRPRATP